LTSSDSNDIDPAWSPDGSKIAFVSSRSGKPQLYIMNADGSNPRQVTDIDRIGGRNSFSPDGQWLSFYAGRSGSRNIYTIRVDGSGLRQLTDESDNLGPSWSPYGGWITFTSVRHGNNDIYIMRTDGSDVTRLTDAPVSDWQPRWGRGD
jgi:TolB protein